MRSSASSSVLIVLSIESFNYELERRDIAGFKMEIPRKRIVVIVSVAIIVVVLVVLLFNGNLSFLYSSNKKAITSTDLRVLGFQVVDGWIAEHSGVIFLQQPDAFVNLARQWNITTIFRTYDAAIFAYQGVLYCYSW